jgi:hypothetical protein
VAKIMERLPVELIELTLVGCEAQLVAVSIPRVSKLFKQLTDDDSAVWKAKCEQKYLSSNSKDEDELSWKRHYFADPLVLFPIFGFTLTKTTDKELFDTPNTRRGQSGVTEYVEYEGHTFWIFDGIFDMMYLTDSDQLPYEWIDQGLSFDISWVELKELLRKKVGNYKVITPPHQGTFQNEPCFRAELDTVIKQGTGSDAFYYNMTFVFNFTQGTETSPKTLYSISIRGDKDSRGIYALRECED